MLSDSLGKLFRSRAARRYKSIVDTFEVVVVFKLLYSVLYTFECVTCSRTACRAEKYKLVKGEISLIEDAQELLSHRAADANDSNFHIIFFCVFIIYASLSCALLFSLRNATTSQKYKEKLHIIERCCSFFVNLPE